MVGRIVGQREIRDIPVTKLFHRGIRLTLPKAVADKASHVSPRYPYRDIQWTKHPVSVRRVSPAELQAKSIELGTDQVVAERESVQRMVPPARWPITSSAVRGVYN